MYATSHFVQTPYTNPNIYHYPPPCSASPLASALDQRKRDTQFVNSFVDSSIPQPPTASKKRRLGIVETRELISSIKTLNVALENSTNSLKQKKESSEIEWQEELTRCKELKEKIKILISELKHEEGILKFKKLVERRKKQRLREKRKKSEWQVKKNLREERRKKRHNEIDNWIREKREMIDREKQEENLRRDADLVLGDIRSKRGDSKKYLNILRELQNLRKVKVSNARARGENFLPAAEESFERIISQLIDQWSRLDREYSIEEHGLKLMLKTDNERIIAKKKRNSYDDWEFVIFGRRLPPPESVSRDLHGLVVTRYAWDRYISYEGARIPVGWVVPEPPSSATWQRCLKK